jgi:hypothetical protein
VGPRAGLDNGGKSRPPPGFDPRTVQPVASRYTDYATRPTFILYYCINTREYNKKVKLFFVQAVKPYRVSLRIAPSILNLCAR